MTAVALIYLGAAVGSTAFALGIGAVVADALGYYDLKDQAADLGMDLVKVAYLILAVACVWGLFS